VAHTRSRLGECGYLNASVCHATVEMSCLNHSILVTVYNPLAWPRSEGIRVPINTSASHNWTVTGASLFCAVLAFGCMHLVVFHLAERAVHPLQTITSFFIAAISACLGVNYQPDAEQRLQHWCSECS
jgi:hypothetical protein